MQTQGANRQAGAFDIAQCSETRTIGFSLKPEADDDVPAEQSA